MSGILNLVVAGGVRVELTNQSVISGGAGAQTATYTLSNAGQASRATTGGGTVNIASQWVRPTSAAGAVYECRATVTSGALSTGTAGTWLALNTTRAWTVSIAVIGTAAATITVEIRVAASGLVLASASIDLTAERTI
jgi:hypothetical protein